MKLDPSMILPLMGMKGGDKMSILSSLMGGDKNGFTDNLPPNSKQILDLIKMNAKKKPPAEGLRAIENIASNDILGMLLRHYSRR